MLLKISQTPQFHQDFQAILRSLGGLNSQSHQLDSSLSSLSGLNEYRGSITLRHPSFSRLPLRSIHPTSLPPSTKHWSPFPVTCVENSQSRTTSAMRDWSTSRCSKRPLLRPWLVSHHCDASALCRDSPPNLPWGGYMRKALPGPTSKGHLHLYRPYNPG